MVRKVLGFSMFTALLALAFAGCGGGFSEEKATQRCDQEKANKLCMTDAAYAQCLSCFQECGDQCVITAACPDTYSCDGSDGSGGAGGATTSQ